MFSKKRACCMYLLSIPYYVVRSSSNQRVASMIFHGRLASREPGQENPGGQKHNTGVMDAIEPEVAALLRQSGRATSRPNVLGARWGAAGTNPGEPGRGVLGNRV